MSSEELAALKGMLAANPFDFTIPAAEVRAQFNGATATFPVDETYAFEEKKVGTVSGLWLNTAKHSDYVLYYIHGGAMLVGDTFGYRGLTGNLARAAGINMFSLEYRLAPEDPFPAAIDDALAGYKGLLEPGYPADKIVLAGDSAGGGLALSLLLDLKKADIALPKAVVTLSPWADLTHSGPTITSKADVDGSLNLPGLESGANQYANGHDKKDPRISPLFGDLSGLPPLLIEVGSHEILLSDATRVAEKAAAGETDVTLHVWPEMPHDWSLFSFMLSEGRDMIDEVGAWIKSKI